MGHREDMSAFDHAKIAVVVGFSYLAAKRPKAAARALLQIGAHYAIQVFTDARALSRIIGKELLVPEVEEVRSYPRPLAGSIVVVSPWIPFVLFGGILVNAIDQLDLTSTGDTANGTEWSGATMTFDAR
jgi:hypothetical protein